MERLNQVASALQADELITIEVDAGDEGDQETFMAPRSLLCAASDYFVRALNGQFQEAGERCIRLPGADVDSVKVFLYWICEKAVPTFFSDIKGCVSGSDEKRDVVLQCHKILAGVWMLGEQVMMPAMQNAAMHEMLEIMEHVETPIEAMSYGYTLGRGLRLGEVYAVQAVHEYICTDNVTNGELVSFAVVEGLLEEILEHMYHEVREMMQDLQPGKDDRAQGPLSAWEQKDRFEKPA